MKHAVSPSGPICHTAIDLKTAVFSPRSDKRKIKVSITPDVMIAHTVLGPGLDAIRKNKVAGKKTPSIEMPISGNCLNMPLARSLYPSGITPSHSGFLNDSISGDTVNRCLAHCTGISLHGPCGVSPEFSTNRIVSFFS
jgi:hypothetical protein